MGLTFPEPGRVPVVLRRAEAEAYLNAAFGDRAGFVAVAFGVGPFWTARDAYRHRDRRERRYRWPAQRSALLNDVAGYLADADAGGPLVDVYVCPHLRRSAEGRRKGDALPVLALHSDMDGPPADRALWDALDMLVVESGSPGHLHGLAMLDEPLDDLARFDQFQRALRDGLGGGADSKIADNDLLRLPGTWNFKTAVPREGEPAGVPTPVVLLPGAPRVSTLAELAEPLGVDLTRPAPPIVTAVAGATDAPVTVVPVPVDLAPRVQAAVDGFADATDRSAHWHKLIGCAHSAGYSRDEAFAIVVKYGLPHIERYAPRALAMFDLSWAKVQMWQGERDAAAVNLADVRAAIERYGWSVQEMRDLLYLLPEVNVAARDRRAIREFLDRTDAARRPAPVRAVRAVPEPADVGADERSTDTVPEMWTLDVAAPTLDPERAPRFARHVERQVATLLTRTRKGIETEVTKWARQHWGVAAALWCRARVLGGLGYYPEAAVDAAALGARFLAATRASGLAGLDQVTDDRLTEAWRDGWASGLRAPMLPVGKDDPRRMIGGRKRGVLPPAPEMPVPAAPDPRVERVERARLEVPRSGRTPLVLLAELLADVRGWQHLPDATPLLAALAVAVTAEDGEGDPPWLLLVAPPSSGKTELVRVFVLVAAATLDDVTVGGLLTWSGGKAPQPAGLLTRVRRGLVTLGDLSSLLAGSDHGGRDEVFGLLRRVADGELTREVAPSGGGDTGGAPLHWEGRIQVLGAVTGVIDRYANHNAELGDRWLHCRLRDLSRVEQRTASRMCRARDLPGHRDRVAKLVAELVDAARSALVGTELPEVLADAIEDAALVAALGRAAVPRATSGRREVEDVATVEAPMRLVRQLSSVAHGVLALGLDVDQAAAVCRRLALDSMPAARFGVLAALAGAGEPMSTAQVARASGLHWNVASRRLEELAVIGAVDALGLGDDGSEAPDVVVGESDAVPDRRVSTRWRLAEGDVDLIRAVLGAPTSADMSHESGGVRG